MSLRVLCATLCLAQALFVPSRTVVAAESAEEVTEVILTGVLSRDEIEAAVPDFVEAEVLAEPDPTAVAGLAAALPGAEVEVYLGTWCSDSLREMGRLWRALDDAGLFDPGELTYIGLDRSMLAPIDRLGEREIRFVPTIFVRRDGVDLGRIVESSPDGIERDLLALLEGTKRGLVSGRSDLAAVGANHRDPEGRR